MSPIEFHHVFITNLQNWGGWTFTEHQEKFLYENLQNRSQNDLMTAARDIVRSSKKKPTVAEIINAAPRKPEGIVNVKPREDEPYTPYPMKFIRDVVQPALQEYASGLGMEQWKAAFSEMKSRWEAENFRIDSYTPTPEDYRYSQAYFASVMKAMTSQLARKNYSMNRNPAFQKEHEATA